MSHTNFRSLLAYCRYIQWECQRFRKTDWIKWKKTHKLCLFFAQCLQGAVQRSFKSTKEVKGKNLIDLTFSNWFNHLLFSTYSHSVPPIRYKFYFHSILLSTKYILFKILICLYRKSHIDFHVYFHPFLFSKQYYLPVKIWVNWREKYFLPIIMFSCTHRAPLNLSPTKSTIEILFPVCYHVLNCDRILSSTHVCCVYVLSLCFFFILFFFGNSFFISFPSWF